MENTLIIGIAGAGKTTKLKELLNEVPDNVRITICEPIKDANHNEYSINIEVSEMSTKQDIHAKLTEVLKEEPDKVRITVREPVEDATDYDDSKPSLIIVDEISNFQDLSIPLGVPIYATLQASTKEAAQEILTDSNIEVDFKRVILLERTDGIQTMSLLDW